MTKEGMAPLAPLTTERLKELLSELEETGINLLSEDGAHSIRHALAELIDIRESLTRIAIGCPHKATAERLVELVGVDA